MLTKLELGGAQKICLALLDGVPEDTLSSGLISGTEGPLVEQAKQYDNVYLMDSLRREVGIKTVLSEFLAFFKMISYMRRMKKKHPRVVIHTHSTKAGLMGRWAALFAGIKKRVHTVHGFGFHPHQSKLGYAINVTLEYITSLITTHYVCVSKKDQETGATYFPRFLQKSSIIRAAVDWDTFYLATKAPTSDAFIYGTISCFKPQKNIFDLLKAFTHVKQKHPDKRIMLHIIGDGAQRPQIETWIQTHNMKKYIKLLGWQDDVSGWLKMWDAFVMSSLWEGLPCSIIEARLRRLPVVSYKISGIPEVISHDKNGFLAEPGNWQQLSHYMEQLLQKDLYQRISTYPENLHDFKKEVMVAQHKDLYKKMF